MENLMEINQASLEQNKSEILAVISDVNYSKSINDLIDYCDNSYRDAVASFFELGKCLSELKESWKEDVLKISFQDFCEKRYGLKKSNIYNLINVYENFKDERGYLDDRFSEFSFSSLVELLPVSDDKEFSSKLKGCSVKKLRYSISVLKKSDFEEIDFIKAFLILQNLIEQGNEKDKTLDIRLLSQPSWTEGYNKKFDFHPREDWREPKLYFYIGICDSSKYLNKKYGSKILKESAYFNGQEDFVLFFNYSYVRLKEESFEKCASELRENVKSYLKDLKDDESEKREKEKYVPTGAIKELGLKKKEIYDYVSNQENYDSSKTVHVELGLLKVDLLPLRGCKYIFGCKYVKDDGQEMFIHVDQHLNPIYSKWDIEFFMAKE